MKSNYFYFNLNEKEIKKLNNWIKENKINKKAYSSGNVSYIFTVGAIGEVKQVKNNLNGKIFDITDYASW